MRAEEAVTAMTRDEVHAYCREVEAYLCRRNDGHLIRVVGPAFELVKGWAEQGVPLTLVRQAIDRVVERAEKRPQARKRPIRIEFCDADVLEAFDRWRRAVGVVHGAPAEASVPRRGSLHAHVDRVVVQLAAALGSDRVPAALRPAIQTALAALDGVQATSTTARGAARDALVVSLSGIDRALVEAATAALPAETLAALAAEAAGELAAFRGRLPAAQWDIAVSAARGRLVRAVAGIPIVSFE